MFVERINWLLEGLSTAAPGVAGALVFIAFGVAVAWLLGLRNPLLLLVAALPAGIGSLALVAQLLGTLGLSTSLLVDALLTLAAAIAFGASRALWMRRTGGLDRLTDSPPALVWAGGVLGAAISMGVWLAGIGNFVVPPQGNDDIWHGYLVERLTHMPAITAATVAPNLVDTAQPIVYYPYGLHLATALVHSATGVGVAEALNGTCVIFIGLLLPFGIAALSWRLFPSRPPVAFWSGTLAAAVSGFPYLTNGILPYTATLAMVPGFLAVLLAFLDRRLCVPGVLVSVTAVGIFVAHPAPAIAAAVLAAPLVAEELLRAARREIRAVAQGLGVVALLAGLGALPWIMSASNPFGTSTASPLVAGPIPAALMFLTLASPWTPAQPALALLTMVGVVSTVAVRRGVSFAVGFLVFGALLTGLLAGIQVAYDLTSPWYGQWYRLIAIVGLAVPVLAGLGINSIISAARRIGWRFTVRRATVALPAITLAIGGLALVATAYDAARGQSIVRTAWHQGLVTVQDLELFRALSAHASPTDKVLNSPRDGSTWMYALYDVTPVMPYVYAGVPGISVLNLLSGYGEYATPAVACQTLEQLGVTYAIAKNVRGADANDPYDVAGFVSRHSGLFSALAENASGVVYRIDRQALAECADS